MPTPPLAEAEIRRVFALVQEAVDKGYPPPGGTLRRGEVGALRRVDTLLGREGADYARRCVAAGGRIGLALTIPARAPVAIEPNDFEARRAARKGDRGPATMTMAASRDDVKTMPADPQEARNAAFWRKRATDTAADLADTRHMLDQVSGVMRRPLDPPKWTQPRTSGRKNRAMGLLHISDIHGGEVIRPEEVNGLNEYNLDICGDRLKRLFDASIAILPRWAADCRLEGLLIALNGDLVSGDIHDELRRTNALTAQQQVYFVGDHLAAGIERAANAFGKVLVVVTPGNHGRSTLKTQAKGTAALSYDTMIGEQLRRHFARDKRVTVDVSPSRDAVYKVFDWTILQSHGDQGGGGGQGFAGPGLPILRKNKSVEYMAAQSRVFYDMILTAHMHSSFNLGKGLANGSVVGYGEFARSIRAAPEPAQQWLALVHEKWCLRERCEIKLQDEDRA